MSLTAKDRKDRLRVRWMIRRDMSEVLSIENEGFEFPWLEEDFIRCLRQRNCIGMVGEVRDQVVAFMVYELEKSLIRVLNFAVSKDRWREGFGTIMMDKLKGKLSLNRRTKINLDVRESNLPAQQFFKAQGFKFVSVLREYYPGVTDEDGYVMQYRPGESRAYQPTNRISNQKETQ